MLALINNLFEMYAHWVMSMYIYTYIRKLPIEQQILI